MAKTPMTIRGAELLRAELQRLKAVERPNVIAAIAEARRLDPKNARAIVAEAKPLLFAPPEHGRDLRAGIALLAVAYLYPGVQVIAPDGTALWYMADTHWNQQGHELAAPADAEHRGRAAVDPPGEGPGQCRAG